MNCREACLKFIEFTILYYCFYFFCIFIKGERCIMARCAFLREIDHLVICRRVPMPSTPVMAIVV